MTALPRSEPEVRVIEVGPRDGLQNEPITIPTLAKIAFIDDLAAAGLKVIEATSFVSPKAVPQLADAADVMTGIHRLSGIRYPVLVPNERGFDRAVAAGVDAIALFTSATEAFAQANVGTSIDGTFERFAPIAQRARAAGIWIRGYVSVAFGCPYSGAVTPEAVLDVASRLFSLGCAEVSIADTIGVADPDAVHRLLRLVKQSLPVDQLALHFHDTSGRAIENVGAGLEEGVTAYDASAGGLGGCPFAPGAPGNLATETLVAFLSQRGLDTGVDLPVLGRAVQNLQLAMPVAETGRPM